MIGATIKLHLLQMVITSLSLMMPIKLHCNKFPSYILYSAFSFFPSLTFPLERSTTLQLSILPNSLSFKLFIFVVGETTKTSGSKPGAINQ